MTDCVIVQPIARSGVDLLKRAGLSVFEAPSPDLHVLMPHLATARAVITRNAGFSAEAIEAAPKLKIIASHGTGTDRIDEAEATRRGIQVTNTPGSNAQSVAEHALALMLACARQLPLADTCVRKGDWSFRERAHPREICGSRLGLVGYGHVAKKLAVMAKSLGMTVMVYTKHSDKGELAAHSLLPAPSLEDLLASSDIISLHCLPGSIPVLDRKWLAHVRQDALVINTARGALIDEAALAEALWAGRIAAAGLDVFSSEPVPSDSPLLKCPRLVLTPHMGGSGAKALEQTALDVTRKVIEGLGLALPE